MSQHDEGTSPSDDDHRFRPEDTDDDDYAVGEGYAAAPAPGGGTSTGPYAADPSVNAGPGSPTEPSGPTGPKPAATGGPGSSTPSPYPDSAAAGEYWWSGPPRSSRGCSGRALFGMLGVAALVLFGVVSCLGNLLGPDSPNSGSGSDPSTPTPDMEVAWLSSAHDLDPGLPADAEMRLGVDGSFTGVNFVPGQDVWIVVLSPSAGKSEQVVGVDPTDGHARWNRELPGVLCGDKVLDGALVCLSGEAGSWTGHVIDVATGEDLTTWPTTLDSALSVHLTPGGLVVVGEAAPAPHARLTLLALDGTVRWSLDVGELQNAELLFGTFLADDFSGQNDPEATMERLRWRDLDEGRVLLWSTPGVALIDPTTGDVVVHECRRATPVGEAYFCGTDAGIERHDLTGAVAWTTPGLDLAFPPDTSNGRPAALSADHQLYAVDWRTGVQGQNLHRFRPTANSFTGTVLAPGAAGDGDHLFVVGDDAVVALAPGSDEVAWTYVLDEYANAVAVVGDMAVLDSWPAIGLDLATGEELWRRSIGPGIYQVAVDDSLVSIGFDGIALLVLP